MQKVNLISNFFFKILHFEERCNVISQGHFRTIREKQNQIRDLRWQINTNMIFQLRLIPGKANHKIFQKTEKVPCLAHYAHFGAKKNFPQNSVL